MSAQQVFAATTALRWTRPDLAGALAGHLMESADGASDRDSWLTAAGWRVHAAAAVGDGREIASEVLEALSRWGSDALMAPAAVRLRLELAVLGHDAGETGTATALLGSVPGDDADPEVLADAAIARLRCGGDGPLDPTDSLAAWTSVGGPAAQVGSAAALLLTAAADRRNGRPVEAVARAADGLSRLDRARPSPRALSPSPHLAAALAAEWISSLIEAGRSDQASEGSRPLRERLVEHTRPTRQLALLRLTLTRVAAAEAGGAAGDLVRELERAAHEAAASDTPELEHICRTALGEVHEFAGRSDAARESVRLAVVADRRHRVRAARFRTALVSLPGLVAGPGAAPPSASVVEEAPDRRLREIRRIIGGEGGRRTPDRERPVVEPHPARETGPAGSADRTAKLRAVQAASMAEHRPPDTAPDGAGRGRRRRRAEGGSEAPANGTAWGAVAWTNGHGDPDGRDDGSGLKTNGRATHDRSAHDRSAHDRSAHDRSAGDDSAGVRPAGDRSAGDRASDDRASDDRGTGRGVHGRGANGRGANGNGSGETASGETASGETASGETGSGGTASGGTGAGGHSRVDRATRRSGGPAGSAAQDRPDPWSTGVWSAGAWAVDAVPAPAHRADPGPAPHRADAAQADEAPVESDGPVNGHSGRTAVASALADPEAWLASALADLDRIWGRRPDGQDTGRENTSQESADEQVVDRVEHDRPGGEPASPRCVVVIDLARGGVRLPADESAPTMRRVARRLAQRLPTSGRLDRSTPDAVSVVLADGDRAAAAEWMRRVVPALVDGLAVDAAVQGALLRAAVHDEHGVVGAQVLQRLDGGRSRPDADPASIPSGQAARRSEAADGGRPADGLDVPAAPVAGPVDAGRSVTGIEVTAMQGPLHTGPGRAVDGPDAPAARGLSHAEPGRSVDGPDTRGPSRPDGADVPGSHPPGPAVGPGAPGRHDDSGGRRPYLPDGVVVRPGSGGRRHRRGDGPTPDPLGADATPGPTTGGPTDPEPTLRAPTTSEPDPAAGPPRAHGPGEQRTTPASAGPSSTDGLGLADLLAGALAAYRGI
ncbi:hypothetical protein [Pseudonocardia abyssalis]|uniref:GGDEF domain-containing protein n=1 Tax=Pseudonocardia abyssalis TaxID=2792008 RepID=A0ABS6UKE4_9PSEU|nr:hypothetical protein [Pseudonocardia abyssalis]MBW0116005.1 hypothetical protein [Pseudonocardia abyssalis]MBW0132647.1 hypothetical protein [Pseudonocardia abyssalis]